MTTKHNPLRAALAAAIEAREDAKRRAEAATAALDVYDGNLDETRSAWARADDELQAARAHEEDLLRRHAGNLQQVAVHCARAGLPMPKDRIDRAAADVADKRRFLDIGNDGRLAIEAAKIIGDEDCERAARNVSDAVRDVLAASVAGPLGVAREKTAELGPLFSVLLTLTKRLYSSQNNDPVLRDLRSFLMSNPLPTLNMGSTAEQDAAGAQAVAAWDAAWTALHVDAGAAVPT